MKTDDLRKELEEVVGPGNLSDQSSMAPPSAWNASPYLVVSPGSPAEVRAVVVAAERANAALIPFGGGNQLYTGYPPASDRLQVMLSTRRMNRVLDHQPDDLTITCESGVTLRQVENSLLAHRQTLALDGPLPESSTLGGLVASATAGIRRHAYGTPRDLLIGLRAVMAGGVEIKGGGKVVKNVAGYDVCKLFTGSWGSLGVLTELTFKVRPLPESRRTFAWYTHDIASAVRVGFDLHLARLAPTMILATNDFKGRHALIVGLEGVAQRIQWQMDEFCRKVACADVAGEPIELTPADLCVLNDWPAIKSKTASVAARVACLPSELEKLVGRVAAIPSAAIFADCTVGGVHCTFQQANHVTMNRFKDALPKPANCVWTILELEDNQAAGISRWGITKEEAHLHRSIKSTLDPSNTFSPGRFPGAA